MDNALIATGTLGGSIFHRHSKRPNLSKKEPATIFFFFLLTFYPLHPLLK
jgi:hypothetical protein